MAKVLKNKVPVSVGIPFYLLTKVDEMAEKEDISRSDFVVQAIIEKIEKKK